jgi:hypothetical protein
MLLRDESDHFIVVEGGRARDRGSAAHTHQFACATDMVIMPVSHHD